MLNKIKFEEWCLRNKLNPNSSSSKTAYEHFKKAIQIQLFIAKVNKKKQLSAEQECSL